MTRVDAFFHQRFHLGSLGEIRDDLLAGLTGAGARPRLLVHVNLHTLFIRDRDPQLAGILRHEGTCALFEGIALKIARLCTAGQWWPDVSGTNLVPATLQAAPPGTRIALVGGRPGVSLAAARRLTACFPHLEVVLAANGYADVADGESIVRKLQSARPDIVLVGLGSPRQERLAFAWHRQLGASIVWTVGGLFDTLSGRVPLAPASLRRLRLEWLWRLIHEPRRLWPRIFFEGPWLLWAMMSRPVRPP